MERGTSRCWNQPECAEKSERQTDAEGIAQTQADGLNSFIYTVEDRHKEKDSEECRIDTERADEDLQASGQAAITV